MTKKQKKVLWRIIATAVLVAVVKIFSIGGVAGTVLYLAAYLIIGYDILRKAFRGIIKGQVFDENFLMAVATVGAIALAVYEKSGDYLEAVAVMLFYQIGELFQSYAVGKSRKNISALMEQHDRDGLGIVPAAGINGQGERAHGSHCHQEVLVKDLPVQDPPAGLLQNVGSDHQIGEQIQGQPERPPDGEQAQCHYQDRRKDDPGERLFLLFVHGKHSFQK